MKSDFMVSTRVAVLQALAKGPSTSHQLAQRIEADSGGLVSPSYPTIQRCLADLLQRGYAARHVRQAPGPGVSPHVYWLTPTGTRVAIQEGDVIRSILASKSAINARAAGVDP